MQTSAVVFLTLTLVWQAWGGEDSFASARAAGLRGSMCTYAAPPLLANHRVDADRLVGELLDLRANTYRWVSRPEPGNFEDLEKFLPLARAHHLRVWVTVIPPSERKPKDTRPMAERLAEYQQWAVQFARLSLTETNFVAWSIDDFVWNLKFFTPDATGRIVLAAREVNPRFAFVPCCYFKEATAKFVKDYGPLCDGVILPYRDESGGANLTNSTHVVSEVKTYREKFGPNCPIIVGVYSSRHSRLGVSAPGYVERVMTAAVKCADGVSVFRHPHKETDAEKYEIVKRVFAGLGSEKGWDKEKLQ